MCRMTKLMIWLVTLNIFPVHKIFKKNDSAERIVILPALHHKEAYKIFSILVKKEIRGKIMQFFKEEMKSGEDMRSR